MALTAAVYVERLLGRVLLAAHPARFTVTVRINHRGWGGRSGADIGPGTHTFMVTVTETLAPVSNTPLLSEEF